MNTILRKSQFQLNYKFKFSQLMDLNELLHKCIMNDEIIICKHLKAPPTYVIEMSS